MSQYDKVGSVEEAEKLIVQYFPKVSSRLAAGNLKDFARIAVFLEDRQRVLAELKELEALVVKKFSQMRQKEFSAKLFLSADQARGVLEATLDEWDRRFNFNSLVNLVEVTDPLNLETDQVVATQGSQKLQTDLGSLKQNLGKAAEAVPTLSGFVAPAAFRRALFRLGYHWRDPGAGEVHGDMTHRLQWFAITSAHSNNRLGLGVAPLYLFQKLANPILWNDQFKANGCSNHAGRALWDFLCDCFVKKVQPDPVDAGPYCSRRSFRSPVSLQFALNKNETLSSKYTDYEELMFKDSDGIPLLKRLVSRGILDIRDVESGLSKGLESSPGNYIVIDYTGPNKTSAMDGKIVFRVR